MFAADFTGFALVESRRVDFGRSIENKSSGGEERLAIEGERRSCLLPSWAAAALWNVARGSFGCPARRRTDARARARSPAGGDRAPGGEQPLASARSWSPFCPVPAAAGGAARASDDKMECSEGDEGGGDDTTPEGRWRAARAAHEASDAVTIAICISPSYYRPVIPRFRPL